jgi:hypothetical protein
MLEGMQLSFMAASLSLYAALAVGIGAVGSAGTTPLYVSRAASTVRNREERLSARLGACLH